MWIMFGTVITLVDINGRYGINDSLDLEFSTCPSIWVPFIMTIALGLVNLIISWLSTPRAGKKPISSNGKIGGRKWNQNKET